MRHTPGPWKVDPPRGAFGYEVTGANNTLICQMCHHPKEQKQAAINAALISAAPDMYAVLKGILEHGLYNAFDTGIGPMDEANEWHNQALAIIDKVEGGG